MYRPLIFVAKEPSATMYVQWHLGDEDITELLRRTLKAHGIASKVQRKEVLKFRASRVDDVIAALATVPCFTQPAVIKFEYWRADDGCSDACRASRSKVYRCKCACNGMFHGSER